MRKISATLLVILLSVFSFVSPVLASTIDTGDLIGLSITKPGTAIEQIGTGASIQGTSKPSDTWNLTDNDYYEFHGNAIYNDLYTNYYFTGASSIVMNVTNYRSSPLTVELYKKGLLVDSKIATITYSSDGTSHYEYTNLNSSSKYYFKFIHPSEFSGNLFKSA